MGWIPGSFWVAPRRRRTTAIGPRACRSGSMLHRRCTNENPRQVALSGVHKFPAMTYSRPRRTTMGPGCLTAVFGMGTGGAIRVCSPRKLSVYKKGEAAELRLSKDQGWAEGGVNAAKRSAVSTGQLSALLHVHIRPIDPVVYREPSSLRKGDLVLRGVSRLDAFSVYPGRTWLPSAAPSGTTGTPEVRPSQSSRTREKAAQVSCARNR